MLKKTKTPRKYTPKSKGKTIDITPIEIDPGLTEFPGPMSDMPHILMRKRERMLKKLK
jgi:hypothetical protein